MSDTICCEINFSQMIAHVSFMVILIILKTLGVWSVTTSEPAKAGGPAETSVFADGSVGTVLLGGEPVETGN